MVNAHQVVTDYTNYAENANVKVFVRARPLDPKDEDSTDLFELGQADDKGHVRKITMKQWKQDAGDWGGVGSNAFAFDGLFWTDAEQKTVFDRVVREQVDHVLKGFNACCFAYGQTGSGKTHSMFFPRGGDDRANADEQSGMIPRAVDYLFEQLNFGMMEAELHVSFLEIYCDTLRDLGKATTDNFKTTNIYQDAKTHQRETFGRGLRRTNSNPGALGKSASQATTSSKVDHTTSKTALSDAASASTAEDHAHEHYYELKEEIREDADGTVFVKGLTRIPVRSREEVLEIIDKGLKLRATEATRMNDTSSRSHTIFSIEVCVTGEGSVEKPLMGKLHLVDLAGSERLKKSESSGIRLQEALHINKSLTALGKVIVALDPATNATHIPYRDSKLTRLLQNSIGGDSYTSLLATIRPALNHAEECLSTLQFANRCRRVANVPQVHRLHETPQDQLKEKDKVIKRLLEEIAQLREKNKKLKARLAQCLGVNPDDLDTNDGSGASVIGGSSGGIMDPALMQAVVAQAVLAALRASGVVGASIDPATGEVKLADGRVLEATSMGAVNRTLAKEKLKETSSTKRAVAIRGSDGRQASHVSAALATRIAKIFGWPATHIPPAVVDILREREEEMDRQTKKLVLSKEEVEEFKKELESVKATSLSKTLKSQSLVDRTRQDRDRACVEEREKVKDAEAQRDTAIAACFRESKVWFDQTAAGQLKRENSANARRDAGLDEVQQLSKKLAAAREEASKSLAQVRNTRGTVEALKAQYEHWIAEKDAEALQFVNQLNAYRSYKRKQQKSSDVELRMLWTSLEKHAAVLRRVRQGRYPLQQLGANHAAPAVPTADLPRIEITLKQLPATKRALSKAAEEEEEDDLAEAELARTGSSTNSIKKKKKKQNKEEENNLFYAMPRTSPRSRTTVRRGVERPTSAPGGMRTDPRRRRITSALPQQVSTNSEKTLPQHKSDDEEDDFIVNDDDDDNNTADLMVASKHRLREMVEDARAELLAAESKMDRDVKHRVASELAAHTTVDYMRQLEAAKLQAEAKASDHARRYAQLRVAYEAQLRQQDNTGNNNSRPGTATTNFSKKKLILTNDNNNHASSAKSTLRRPASAAPLRNRTN